MRKLTKGEALARIKELEDFIKAEEEKPVLEMGPVNFTEPQLKGEQADVKINGQWAFTLFQTTDRSHNNASPEAENAMIYLTGCNGQWYDAEGKTIKGYLSYKPNN